MTDREYDACVDALVELLERANNEKYQLEPSTNEEDQ